MLRLVFLVMLLLQQEKPCLGNAPKINSTTVQEWAEKLQYHLLKMGRDVTNKTEMIKAFKSYSSKTKNGSVLVKEIASMIENMTKLKVSAIKRIADTAEQVAMAHHGEEVPILYKYYSAKTEDPEGEPLNSTLVDFLEFTPSNHFHNHPINTSFSSVHVPTNVYDRTQEVLRAIKWSKELDDIFISNYQEDPSLSWQYFGSSTGILRQYPGSQWDESLLDLYDCRMRLWYTDAATSAKDVIILVDNSGSMKGLRQTIARHLVNNILDTLGSNDFVNVFNFSEDFDSISCFKNGLVQANQGNIRELKLAMKELKPIGMADFSKAFTKAFKLLSKYREQALGANCNQAIMIITDGIPYYYKDIFQEFNWYMLPQMPVRIFTYFLTEEIPDDREIRWIACANRGYYVSLNTLGEVQEQVLRYLPVMSRPLVLSKEHPINWTPLYADVTESMITDWLWEQRENKEQEDVSDYCYPKKYKVRAYNRSAKALINCTEESRIKRAQDRNGEERVYHFMTSVSVPVLDHWGNTSVDAFILGVAGTDVPIEDIKRLTFPEKIGVNGYMFIVTNNGHVVIHPDLRPLFLGILKPNFNSIDVLEIEQIDDNHGAREWNRELIELRKALVNQTTGKKTLTTKFQYDDMKRISGNMTQHYYYTGISGTPFTLVIALPAHYGTRLVQVPNINLLGRNLTQYFRGSWNVHPEWDYCKYHYDSLHDFASPEAEILHFLQKMRDNTWQWPKERFLTTPEQLLNTPPGKVESANRDSYYCNRDLFEALIADAIATSSFPKRPNALYGVVLNFIATHSGLTRWLSSPENYKLNRKFIQENRKAIDELWYKRAVEQQEEGFVYSVSFGSNNGHEDDNLVTATSAIWVPTTTRIPISKKVPAAVLGYRFHHGYLHHMFNNVTSSCAGCKITCASDELDCYLLDNHGYVMASESTSDRGKFFGEIQGLVMESMVKENIYRRIRVYDYQAICFRSNEAAEGVAPLIVTPLNHAKWMLNWLFQIAVQLLTEIGFSLVWHDNLVSDAKPKPTMLPREQVKIQRTHLEHCDQQIDLYQLDSRLVTNGLFGDTPHCTKSYFVQKVNYSNLVIVVVNVNCVMEDEGAFMAVPEEVEYYNTTLACLKVDSIFTMDRQRPKICINNDTKEPEITECGKAVNIQSNLVYCFSFIIIYILKVM